MQKEKPWTADTVCRVASQLLTHPDPIEISAEDIVSMQAQFWMLENAVPEDRIVPDCLLVSIRHFLTLNSVNKTLSDTK